MDSAFRKMMDLSSLWRKYWLRPARPQRISTIGMSLIDPEIIWDPLGTLPLYWLTVSFLPNSSIPQMVIPYIYTVYDQPPACLAFHHLLLGPTSRPVSTQSHFSGISGGTFLPKSFIYTSHIFTYLHISPHIFTYLHISSHIFTYLHISSHIFTYLHISSHIFTYLHISSHIFTYLHISSHIFTYLHISSHIFTYLHILFPFVPSASRFLLNFLQGSQVTLFDATRESFAWGSRRPHEDGALLSTASHKWGLASPVAQWQANESKLCDMYWFNISEMNLSF